MGHEHFQFAVLPFGLTGAPQVFTVVMAVVAEHLRRSGVPVFPLPQLLAAEGGLATDSRHPPPDYGEPPAFAGVHYQHAEVTPDSFSDASLHLSHSGHGAVLRLPSKAEYPEHLSYDPDVSTSVLDIGETDSEATWSDGLLHPAGEAYQVAHAGSAVGLEVPVATASGESL